jgi:hypothetical protein
VKRRSKKSIEADAIGFRDRMNFLEMAWNAKVEYEVDLATGKCWFKVTPEGASTTLVVHDVLAWNVILPSSGG